MILRDRLRPIIADVIQRVGTSDMKTLRNALRHAYPCGPYDYHPRKIWLSEIRVQLGLARPKRRKGDRQPVEPDKSQQELFE